MLSKTLTGLGLFAGLAAVAVSSAAWASSLYVNPVRLVLNPDKRTALLSVRNDGTTPLSFRMQAFDWSQSNGEDVRTPASDLIMSPPIATVAPGSVQLVRIGPKKRDSSREHAYRVIVQEIPGPASSGKISLAVRFDLPLYIPTARKSAPSVRWQAHMDGGKLQLEGENLGVSHVEVHKIYLASKKLQPLELHGANSVILANSHKTWTLPAAWQSNGIENIVADTSAGVAQIQVTEGAR